MTDPNYTHLALVVDRSGSMQRIQADMNGGIKTLLADQAKLPGKLLVEVATFDNDVEFIYTDAKVEDIREGLVEPRGSTALLDAIGQMITRLGNKFKTMPEDARPGTVIVAIITDGYENASREFKADQIKEMVEEQSGRWNWTFMYLAANVDAFETGAAYGFAPGQTMSYDAEQSRGMTQSLSASASRARKGKSANFTEEERKAAQTS